MWPNPQETAHLVTFTEEILNGKLNVLCSSTLACHYQENILFMWLYPLNLFTNFILLKSLKITLELSTHKSSEYNLNSPRRVREETQNYAQANSHI